jgi:hypothetical protein
MIFRSFLLLILCFAQINLVFAHTDSEIRAMKCNYIHQKIELLESKIILNQTIDPKYDNTRLEKQIISNENFFEKTCRKSKQVELVFFNAAENISFSQQVSFFNKG